MTDSDRPDGPASAADAELADAMHSIQSTGEDWRSSERGTDHAEDETGHDEPTAGERAGDETDKEIDNG